MSQTSHFHLRHLTKQKVCEFVGLDLGKEEQLNWTSLVVLYCRAQKTLSTYAILINKVHQPITNNESFKITNDFLHCSYFCHSTYKEETCELLE